MALLKIICFKSNNKKAHANLISLDTLGLIKYLTQSEVINNLTLAAYKNGLMTYFGLLQFK